LSVSAQVNFQPATSAAPAGFVADSGQAYADRGNGLTYGWTADNTANVRQRTGIPAIGAGSDGRFHTLAMMQQAGNVSWEIAVPNGRYRVHVVAGDPQFATAVERINAEGVQIVNGIPSVPSPWVEGFAIVTVSDGKLTLSPGSGAYQTKIDYVEFSDDLNTPFPPTAFPAVTRPVSIGTNVDAISYFSTLGPFHDLAAEFNRWGSLAKPSDPETNTAPLNADNYPLADAAAITFATGYPTGDYAVSYRGTGTVSFAKYGHDADGNRVIEELPFTPALGGDGAMHGTVHLEIPATIEQWYFVLRITGVDAQDPVHDVHVLSPDSNPDPNNPFRPIFLQKLAAFDGPLRMMGWGQTNWNSWVNWSDRTTPSHFSYYANAGIPYEYYPVLANLLHKDLWINIPHQASTPFIDAFAKLIRDNLDPSLKVYVEYSNETWNSTFSNNPANLGQYTFLNARAAVDGLTQAQEMGKQTLRVAEEFLTTFGATRYASQVRTILGGFIVDGNRSQQALDWIKNQIAITHPGHRVNEYISGLAVAPYVGNEGDMASINNVDLTLDALFAWMNNFVDTTLDAWLKLNHQVADQYEITMEAYEGGHHLQALAAPETADVKLAAQTDPRMGDFYRHLIQKWITDGGNTFGNFTLASKYTPAGYWGMLTNIKYPTDQSVRYTSIAALAGQTMTFINQPEEQVPGTPTPPPTPPPKPKPKPPVTKLVGKPAPVIKPAPPKRAPAVLPPAPPVKPATFATKKKVARLFD
jgi:hypothetical protein